jgi:hypothetical protein
MAEAVGLRRDEAAAQWVSLVLLAGSFLLFLLQLPEVLPRHVEFSAWTYVPGLLAMMVAVWKKADHVAMLAIFWMSTFFMIDVFYGVSFFA